MNASLPPTRILVIDDEANMRRVLEIMLARGGHDVLTAENGLEALALLEKQGIDLIISDMRMPGMDGLALLQRLREKGSAVPVIVVTAHGTIDSAVEAMRNGAVDYLLRPFDIDALELSIARILRDAQRNQQISYLREEIERDWGVLIGSGTAMERVREAVRQVAPTKAAVLITGETGTGKEIVARAVHGASPRKNNLFVPVNCAAIPRDILEAELFGYEKGAFTGATKERIGKFEMADGGTLFLDEVTEMPIELQAKLLRFLQDNTLERIGSNRSIQLDIRVVAASNRDPRAAIAQGLLREDLYYRLNVFPINLPPLRERVGDIGQLIDHFLVKHDAANQLGRLGGTTIEKMARYSWPGNVRELENLVERALILCGGEALEDRHFSLPVEATGARSIAPETADALSPAVEPMQAAVERLEALLISGALKTAGGNKAKAAALLDISERSLWYKLKKFMPNLDS